MIAARPLSSLSCVYLLEVTRSSRWKSCYDFQSFWKENREVTTCKEEHEQASDNNLATLPERHTVVVLQARLGSAVPRRVWVRDLEEVFYLRTC